MFWPPKVPQTGVLDRTTATIVLVLGVLFTLPIVGVIVACVAVPIAGVLGWLLGEPDFSPALAVAVGLVIVVGGACCYSWAFRTPRKRRRRHEALDYVTDETLDDWLQQSAPPSPPPPAQCADRGKFAE
jgi:hypothetical protein